MPSKVLPWGFLSSYTHALHELSWLVEFCMFRNLFLNSLLYLCLVLRCSLIVLSVAYTCVFWNWPEKFDLCEFFSVFLMFQCGASKRSLLASKRIRGPNSTFLESGREWSPIVQTGPACVRTSTVTTGQTVSKTVQTCATCPHVPNAAHVRTKLLHSPDGDPTEAIYTPESPLSPPHPTKSPLWHFVSDCFWCFWSNFIPTCLLCILTPFQVFF